MSRQTKISVAAKITKGDKYLVLDHVKLDMIAVPAGKMEEWECPHEALARELKEEIGVTRYRVNGYAMEYSEEYDVNLFVFDVTLTDESEITNMEPEKHRWVKFMDLREIDALGKKKAEVLYIALSM